MRKLLYLFLIAWSMLKLMGCADTPELISPEPIVKDSIGWKQYLIDDMIMLCSHVANNELRIYAYRQYAIINNAGKRDIVYGSPYKPAITDRAALSRHFVFSIMNATHASIRLSDYYVTDGTGIGFSVGGNSPYSRFIWAKQYGAYNAREELFAVVQDTTAQRRLHVMLMATPEISGESGYINPYPEIKFVPLPDASGDSIRLIKAFRNNCLISTEKSTLLVRPDGSSTQVFPSTIADAIEHNGILYADVGKDVYQSTDDGINWQLHRSNAPAAGEREFASVGKQLVYFKQDSLFLVNPSTFDVQALGIKGLAGNKITSVAYFRKCWWVTTLTGLFYKNEEEVL